MTRKPKASIQKRLAVFLKFHSTQVVLFFVSLAGAWAVAPEDWKNDLLSKYPFFIQYKAEIGLVLFLISFYKTRMNSQVVPRIDKVPKPESTVVVDEPPKEQ